MDMELKGLPSATRNKLIGRYNNFKSDLSKLKKDLARVSSNRDRDELLAGGTSDYDSASMDQRQRLLAANARMDRSTKMLQEAQRIGEETGTCTLRFFFMTSVLSLYNFCSRCRCRHPRSIGPAA